MPLPRRVPVGLTRRFARPSQRRFASHDSHGHGHGEAVNESLGKVFYGAIALPPIFYLLWSSSANSQDGEEPWLTRFFHRFDSWQDFYHEQNILHATLVQQAADDKILFDNVGIAAPRRKVALHNAESLNAYSHKSMQTGWSSIDLSKVINHVKQHDADTEAKNTARRERRQADGYYDH